MFEQDIKPGRSLNTNIFKPNNRPEETVADLAAKLKEEEEVRRTDVNELRQYVSAQHMRQEKATNVL